MKTFTCLNCYAKECEKTKIGTFDICSYGISYLNLEDGIETKEPKVPLSTIAKNLRHEINPILQLIIQQASKINPELSTKVINLNNPLSVIVGSTVILDIFIQMITGVHEFHSLPETVTHRRINLKTLITTYYNMYSILKEESRTVDLQLNNLIPDYIFVELGSDYVKYLLAILMDNAWKYSHDNTTLTVNVNNVKNDIFCLKFTNISETYPDYFDPFEMGAKWDKDSKGFGYGLNWAKTLESNYNSIANLPNEYEFRVRHNQIHEEGSKRKRSFQEFSLNNIILNKK